MTGPAVSSPRPEKVATPAAMVAVVVPTRVSVPLVGDTVITVPYSLFSALPYWSKAPMLGWSVNGTPAYADEDGGDRISSL